MSLSRKLLLRAVELQDYYHRWGGEPVGRQRAMPHHKSYARYRSGAALRSLMRESL